ncbi:hypothetical protein SPSYN_01964 [Sporotomaculum syntrophicum]|uniref:Uncharacterized protein n=1 Tax=Sporotomaculum syntrophicum TaxID=182264 RepID=A0A9D3AYH1_9FIRM|nr:hypothetical protein SPSYN_01964 [Sporotomaculum syntrophicum]
MRYNVKITCWNMLIPPGYLQLKNEKVDFMNNKEIVTKENLIEVFRRNQRPSYAENPLAGQTG